MKDLKTICDLTVRDPKYAPERTGDTVITTYCNLAVRHIAEEMGVHLFPSGMLASQMYQLLKTKAEKLSGTMAAEAALAGRLVIAAQDGKPHGHVAVIYPAPLEYSPSWNKYIPMVANVGKTNGIMRTSQAFKIEPEYYVVF